MLPSAVSWSPAPTVTFCVPYRLVLACATPTAATPQVDTSDSVEAVTLSQVPTPMSPVLPSVPFCPSDTESPMVAVKSASVPAPSMAPPVDSVTTSAAWTTVEAEIVRLSTPMPVIEDSGTLATWKSKLSATMTLASPVKVVCEIAAVTLIPPPPPADTAVPVSYWRKLSSAVIERGPAEMIQMPGTFVVAFAVLVAVEVAPLALTTPALVESDEAKYSLLCWASMVTPPATISSAGLPLGGAVRLVVAEPMSSVDAIDALPATTPPLPATVQATSASVAIDWTVSEPTRGSDICG